ADPALALRKHSVKIAGHSTSLSLEDVFWDALKEVAAERGLSLNALIEEIDRGRGGNLSSAVRVFLLNHFRALARSRTSAGLSRPTPSADPAPPS
ncbi:MAG: ribbon-helix-helix domain-containing protein, partial [Kiloniellaceae bacterium]